MSSYSKKSNSASPFQSLASILQGVYCNVSQLGQSHVASNAIVAPTFAASAQKLPVARSLACEKCIMQEDLAQVRFLVKAAPLQYYITEQDKARVHVAALICKDVENERFFTFARPCSWNDIPEVLCELYPEQNL